MDKKKDFTEDVGAPNTSKGSDRVCLNVMKLSIIDDQSQCNWGGNGKSMFTKIMNGSQVKLTSNRNLLSNPNNCIYLSMFKDGNKI